jgi:hypothetical protein
MEFNFGTISSAKQGVHLKSNSLVQAGKALLWCGETFCRRKRPEGRAIKRI